jgi:hypothetical protein
MYVCNVVLGELVYLMYLVSWGYWYIGTTYHTGETVDRW